MLRTMLAAGAMTALGAVPVFLVSSQSVLVRRDLDFSEPLLGLAVSVFFGAAALAAMLGAPLADRMSRRASTSAAGVLAALSALGVAVGARSFGVLLALLALAGVANAALQMTANVGLARTVTPSRQGLAYGVKQSAIPFAILVGGLAVPSIGVLVGWRWTFAATAVVAAVVVLAGLRMPRTRGAAKDVSKAAERAPTGALVVSFVAMTIASGAVNSLGAFLPAWAYRVGLSPSAAGLLLAAGSAASILTRITSGLRADRRRGRNLPVVSTQLALGSVGFVLLSMGDVPLLVLGTFVAFGVGWGWPGLLIFAVVRVGRESPATASGAVQSGAFAGGALGPVLFGLLVATSSYPTAWLTAAVLMLLAAGLLMVARAMFMTDLRRRPPTRPLS